MRVFSIGDLHLAGAFGKSMEPFGPVWHGHAARIADDWDTRVADDDVVLLAGDLSWAMRLPEAEADLAWIAARPGTKIMVRGNHDYWWQSVRRVRQALAPGCVALQNDAWVHPSGELAIAGARLWDDPQLEHGDIFAPQPASAAGLAAAPSPHRDGDATARIYSRELGRLKTSLEALEGSGKAKRLVVLHYPPTNAELVPTAATRLLEAHGICVCVFGHLHGLRDEVVFAGSPNGVRYELVSADYLGMRLLEVCRLSSSGL